MASKIDVTTIKNISEYPNSFKRQGSFPLDLYSLFNTKGATTSTDITTAEGYAQKSGVAYLGQIVTVSDQSSSDPQPRAYIVRNTAKSGSYLDELMLKSEAQSSLTFDSTPKSGSSNPVTSDGVYAATRLSGVGWGGSSMAGAVAPIASAFNDELSANRFAYLPKGTITYEKSTDGGTTWIAQTISDSDHFNLTTGYSNAQSINVAPSDGSAVTTNCQLRLTITHGNVLYFFMRFICLFISTHGASGCKCKIEVSKDGTTYTNVSTYNISGRSGWNYIPVNGTFGPSSSSSSAYTHMRLTFSLSTLDASYNNKLSIQKIRAYGENCWTSPSTLAKTGHMYEPLVGGSTWFESPAIFSELRIGNKSSSYNVESAFTKRINLAGQLQLNSYLRSVIGLCKVSANSSSTGSYSIGRITMHRTNGLQGSVIIDVCCEDGYSQDYLPNVSIIGNLPSSTSVRGCSFTYKGVRYGGIEIFIDDAELSQVVFEGETSDKANVFGVDYYNKNTSSAINTEINNSIKFVSAYRRPNLYYNTKQIAFSSDLSDYVKTASLSDYYTKSQVDALIPEVPTALDHLSLTSSSPVRSSAIVAAFDTDSMSYGKAGDEVIELGPRISSDSNNSLKLMRYDSGNDLSTYGLFVPKIKITTNSSVSGVAKRYTLSYTSDTSGNVVTEQQIGTIDIPKDLVVQSGKVVTVTNNKDSDGATTSGLTNGTYIKLILNSSDSAPIYIAADSLIEYVTGSDSSTDDIKVTVSDDHVVSASINSGKVTEAKIASNAVTTAKIKDLSITTDKIAADSITNAKLANNSVSNLNYVDKSISVSKMSEAVWTYVKSISGTITDTHGFIGSDNGIATSGAAVGDEAMAGAGGAVGDGAVTGSGFAGGAGAISGVKSGNAYIGLDAIQLGTGVNSKNKTLQVYNYRLMDSDGTVPADRLALSSFANLGTYNSDTGKLTISSEMLPSSGVNVEHATTSDGLAIYRYTESA